MNCDNTSLDERSIPALRIRQSLLAVLELECDPKIYAKTRGDIRHSKSNISMSKNNELPVTQLEPGSSLSASIIYSSTHALKSLAKTLRLVKEELDSDSAKDSINARLFRDRIRLEFSGFRDRVDQINALQRQGQESQNWSPFAHRIKCLIEELESLQTNGMSLTQILKNDNHASAFELASREIEQTQDRIREIAERLTV